MIPNPSQGVLPRSRNHLGGIASADLRERIISPFRPLYFSTRNGAISISPSQRELGDFWPRQKDRENSPESVHVSFNNMARARLNIAGNLRRGHRLSPAAYTVSLVKRRTELTSWSFLDRAGVDGADFSSCANGVHAHSAPWWWRGADLALKLP